MKKMARNFNDAACTQCGEEFKQLSGTPPVCSFCQAATRYLKTDGKDKEAEAIISQALVSGLPQRKCLAFHILDAVDEHPLGEAAQKKLTEFENASANLTLVGEYYEKTEKIIKKLKK